MKFEKTKNGIRIEAPNQHQPRQNGYHEPRWHQILALGSETFQSSDALLKNVKKFKITEDAKKDIIQLKEFSVKWNSLGHIPIKSIKINDEFSNVISSFYKKLKVDNSEKEKIQFQLKVDSLKGNLKQLNSEKDFIRKKIDQIHKSILQYENNISFFGKGKGTESLKNEVEKKIENSKLEIENLKKKLTLINKI